MYAACRVRSWHRVFYLDAEYHWWDSTLQTPYRGTARTVSSIRRELPRPCSRYAWLCIRLLYLPYILGEVLPKRCWNVAIFERTSMGNVLCSP